VPVSAVARVIAMQLVAWLTIAAILSVETYDEPINDGDTDESRR
jgi:hypothetical protein